MESIRELKEALTARSQTRSLEELTGGGAKRVKVIRAEHIGAMIDEAVQRVTAESGLISREEAELLVQRSREEFATVHAERQREADELATARRELQSEGRRRHVLEQHVASLEESLEQLEREREDACTQAVQIQAALEAAERRALELEQVLAGTTGGAQVQQPIAPAPVAGAQPPAVTVAPTTAQQLAPSAADPLTAALEKLTASMTDRLEQMGRKMGISGAVEADSVSLDGLFADLDEQKFESNLDSLEVKQRQSGGIAANLARLKKLKGGSSE